MTARWEHELELEPTAHGDLITYDCVEAEDVKHTPKVTGLTLANDHESMLRKLSDMKGAWHLCNDKLNTS